MRYLLEDISDDEKARVEDSFFADDAKFEAMELAEEELIDAFVRNELSAEAQRQFKAKLLRSPRLTERVNFARALIEKADSIILPEAIIAREPEHSFSSRAAPGKTSWLGSVFAQRPAWGMALACAVLLLVGALVLVPGWLRIRKESEQLAAERAALQQRKDELDRRASEQGANTQQLTAELQQEREQRAELIQQLQQAHAFEEKRTRQGALTTIATVFLTPGSLRSGSVGQAQLIIGPETNTARLQLALKNDYPRYNATIKSEGAEIFRSVGLRARVTHSGAQLLLSVPSRLLKANDYIIHVDGVPTSGSPESFNDYHLRVKTSK